MNQRSVPENDEWLSNVFLQHKLPLVHYVQRLVGNSETARDVVQDAFVKLCRQPPERLGTSVTAWLYKVCRNRAIDLIRKERHVSPIEPTTQIAATTQSDPAELAQRRDSARHILGLLAHLPENQQEVVRLKLGHGLSYREIGDVTGLSVSNVGFLLHHALRRLRAELGQES
jgi:RNA polymerase sigma-70 factor (ECF subfamily)